MSTNLAVRITTSDGTQDTLHGDIHDIARSLCDALNGHNSDLPGFPHKYWLAQQSVLLRAGDTITSVVRCEDGYAMVDPCGPLVLRAVVEG